MRIETLSNCISTFLITAAVSIFVLTGISWADTGPPAILDNGTIRLGVNPTGNLVAPGGQPSPVDGTTDVGLRFVPTGNEGIAAKSAQESWGVADYSSGITGSANKAKGNENVTVVDFSSTATTATSVVDILATGDAPSFRVTHEYKPSSSPNLFEAVVTIENTGTTEAGSVRYRRVVDWDAEPTPFDEFVTIGGEQGGELRYTSNEGFADQDPLSAPSNWGASGFFEDHGPEDQGALFDFDFDSLAPGETKVFKLYYGAAANESAALAAIDSVEASVYSLAQPNTADGAGIGNPNTFILAFQTSPTKLTVARDDQVSTDEDSSVEFDVLENDFSDGTNLTVSDFTQPEHGGVECNQDGICNYFPDENFNGKDSFSYSASNDNAESDDATVNLTVRPVKDTPRGVLDEYTVMEDEELRVDAPGVLANDENIDGGNLKARTLWDVYPTECSLYSGCYPEHGELDLALDGSFTYVPEENFSGTDGFYYLVGDDESADTQDYGSTYVTVTVTADEDPPVAEADSYEMNEDEELVVDAPGVLQNDRDIDGSVITAILDSEPQNGTLTLDEDGSFVYEPDADFNGTDTFTYRAGDGQSESEPATATIVVNSVNDAPVADDGEATAEEDNDNATFDLRSLVSDQEATDADITYEIEEEPTAEQGTATISGDDVLTFDPANDFFGTVEIVYSATDEGGLSDEGTLTITVTPVNDAPIANDDTRSTPEDTPLVIQSSSLVTNDTTGAANENQTLTITEVSNAQNGTVVLSEDGETVTFTPIANYSGPASFDYIVCDNGTPQRCSVETATVNVTIEFVNDAPAAENDSYSVAEDGTLVADGTPPGVLDNDTDVEEGDTLTVVDSDPNAAGVQPADGPDNGTLELDADGTFTYTPDENFNGQDTFTYRATDGEANSNLATVTITVGAVNDAPNAVDDGSANDRITVEENGSRLINVLANDSDPDDDELAIQAVGNPSNGEAVVANDQIRYTPDANYNGSDQFTYTVSDGTATDTATVFVSVTPVNSAPVAEDDEATVAEDGSNVTFNLGALVTDEETSDGDITYEIVEGPTAAQGTASITGQNLTYDPADNFNGEVEITYSATDDGDGAAEAKSDTGTLTITVTPVNDPPIARDRTLDADEDTPLEFNVFAGDDPIANDIEVDKNEPGATIVVTNASGADDGTINCATNAGVCTYTPNANFNGADSFTYTVRDSSGATSTGTVNVNVSPVNDAPTANDDTKSTPEDTPLVFPASDLTANDSAGPNNESGQTLTVTAVGNAENGTVQLSGGQITFTPAANYNGPASFDYTVSDGQGNNATATANVNVTVTAVNDAPVADNANQTVAEDGANATFDLGVLVSDQETADADIEYAIVTGPTQAQGTVSITGQTLTFDPANNFNGSVTITYSATDDGDGSDPEKSDNGTLTINVTPANDNPVANNDLKTTDEDTATTINVLTNDTDADGDDLTIQSVSTPQNGTATVSSGSVRYTPNDNFNGEDTFIYTASDGNGGEATGTVRVTVNPVNDQPVAQDDSAESEANQPVTVEVLANDSDPDGDTLSVSSSTQGTDGSVTCTPSGNCIYTPDEDFVGEDSFTYTVSDSNGGTATASVQISVSGPEDETPPETSITSGPNGPTRQTSPSFAFTGSDETMAVGSLEYSYRLDEETWSAYSVATTATLSGVAQGEHTFYVRARDAAGNEDPTPAERTFTVDTTAPTVSGRSPSSGQNGVARNTNVTVTFSEAMDAASVTNSNVTLTKQGASSPVTAAVTYDTASRKATLDPSDANGLESNATYTVLVKGSTGGVRDLAGNTLAQTSTWTFTTADTVAPNPPTLDLDASSDSGTSSTDNLTNDPTPTLSGTVEAGSTVKIYDGDSQIGSATATSTGSWSFTPTTSLTDGTHSLTATATDAANNTSSESQTLTLRIDTTAPTVVSFSPPSTTNTAPIGTNVIVRFSESIDPASLSASTYYLTRSGTTTAVPASMNYAESTKSATLDPSASLTAGTAYTITVRGSTGGVRDLAGNVFASNRTSSFSTNSAPVVTNFAPAQGASTTNRTPPIRATVRDTQTNLAKSNIQFFLNGTARTSFTYDVATDRLSFTPAGNLPLGKNTIKIIATDAQGLKTTKSWSFTVK